MGLNSFNGKQRIGAAFSLESDAWAIITRLSQYTPPRGPRLRAHYLHSEQNASSRKGVVRGVVSIAFSKKLRVALKGTLFAVEL